MITEKQKEAVQELCRYVENFCKENDLSAFMSVTASEDHPDGLEQMTGSIITGKGEYVVGAISGTVKVGQPCLYATFHGTHARYYTRKTDINTIPFGENLNMN
ncbi:hypothetical protein NXW53_10380 [Bacteroides ovatus]|nr:hypothetical protein [Bacteroides ovatus]